MGCTANLMAIGKAVEAYRAEVPTDRHKQWHMERIDEAEERIIQKLPLYEIFSAIAVLYSVPDKDQQNSYSFDEINIATSLRLLHNHLFQLDLRLRTSLNTAMPITRSMVAYIMATHVMAMMSPFFALLGANSICMLCVPAGTLIARSM